MSPDFSSTTRRNDDFYRPSERGADEKLSSVPATDRHQLALSHRSDLNISGDYTAEELVLVFCGNAANARMTWAPSASGDAHTLPFSLENRSALFAAAINRFIEILDEADGVPGIAADSLVGWVLTQPAGRTQLVSEISQLVESELSNYSIARIFQGGDLGSDATVREWIDRTARVAMDRLPDTLERFEVQYAEAISRRLIDSALDTIRSDTQKRASLYINHYPEFATHLSPLALGEPEAVEALVRDVVSRDIQSSLARIRSAECYEGTRSPDVLHMSIIDQRLPAAFLKLVSNAITPSIAADVFNDLKAQASKERRSAESGGIVARAVRAVHTMELDEFRETIDRKILTHMRRGTDPVLVYLDAARTVSAIEPHVWWSSHLASFAFTATLRALDLSISKVLPAAIDQTKKVLKTIKGDAELKSLGERPRIIRTLYGPRLGALVLSVYSLPLAEREKQLDELTSKHLAPLTAGEIAHLAAHYPRSFSRVQARAEVDSSLHELRQKAADQIRAVLSEMSDVKPEGLDSWLSQDGLSSSLLETLFEPELNATAEVHFYLRESSRICAVFSSLLKTESVRRRIAELVPRYVEAATRSSDLTPSPDVVRLIMDKLQVTAAAQHDEARESGNLHLMLIAEKALGDLASAATEDYAWCIEQECEQLLASGALTPENMEVFELTPHSFIDVDRLYHGLFSESVEQLPVEGALSGLRNLLPKLPPLKNDCLSVALFDNSVLVVRGELSDQGLIDQFEAAARSTAAGFLFSYVTGCSIKARAAADCDAYHISITEALSLVERFNNGSGRGSYNQFHYGGSNEVSWKEWFVLGAMGFFKNEPNRVPISAELIELLRTSQATSRHSSPSRNVVRDWASTDAAVEEYLRTTSRRAEAALRSRSLSECVTSQMLHSYVGRNVAKALTTETFRSTSSNDIQAWAERSSSHELNRVRAIVDRLIPLYARGWSRFTAAFLLDGSTVWGAIDIPPGMTSNHVYGIRAQNVPTVCIFQLPAAFEPRSSLPSLVPAPGGWIGSFQNGEHRQRFVTEVLMNNEMPCPHRLLVPTLGFGQLMRFAYDRIWKALTRNKEDTPKGPLRFAGADDVMFIQ